ncbi:PRK06851 family protein [Salirhabdus salicampi]|uniref:PRK06851 family protein n=1 Tax=Salirhabdus salicampi TaxID=476102 RepID=UPI0020C367B3|nr:PRK06851 family protein [Salirhabdus salicampi]MCP8617372.1 PRK06851 family protein [Salirhabdus salicampi]
MAGKTLNYYAGGNTANGFVDLFQSNLEGLTRIFILKGGPGTGKSTLMKKIGEKWNDRYDVEYIHCSADWGSIDGVIFRELGVAVVDGTAPHVLEPKYPGVIEEYVNLGEAWDSKVLQEHKDEVFQLNEEIKTCYDKAYGLFHDALHIHDDWEKFYIDHLDRSKANELTNQLIQDFFQTYQLNKTGKVVHRFLGAATPEGPIDFIQNLTEGLTYRYFIKGRPGSGKSTMLKKIVAAGEERGFDVEVYHCGFDANSLDMVIIRELNISIFDSTSPHEHFPSRKGDEIIDMYEEVIEDGTDERYANELEEVSTKYKSVMEHATKHLKDSLVLRKQLESIYIRAMDFSIVEQKQAEIEKEIESIAKK